MTMGTGAISWLLVTDHRGSSSAISEKKKPDCKGSAARSGAGCLGKAPPPVLGRSLILPSPWSDQPEAAPPPSLPSASSACLTAQESKAMGPPLLLPLLPPLLLPLLPAASLQAGGSGECKLNPTHGVYQPEHLSAPEGGSIDIPFSFCYTWKLASDPNVRIFWKWKDFHGEFFYNTTPPFTSKNFKNRLSLNWKEGQTSGSLRISNLRREDETKYFFRVQVTTRDDGVKEWQSIEGTHLTITKATEKTTTDPTTTTISTTSTTSSTTYGRNVSASGPLPQGAIIGVALAGAVLILAILGLIIYLRWRRSKGLRTKCEKDDVQGGKTARAPDRGSFPNAEEENENVGHEGLHRNSKSDPKVDGILYASLTLSNLTSPSPSAPPSHLLHESPQEETLYSILKT